MSQNLGTVVPSSPVSPESTVMMIGYLLSSIVPFCGAENEAMPTEALAGPMRHLDIEKQRGHE